MPAATGWPTAVSEPMPVRTCSEYTSVSNRWRPKQTIVMPSGVARSAAFGDAGLVTTPQNLDERFRDAITALPHPPGDRRAADDAVRDGTALTGARALELFDAQLASRHLDLAARWLRSFNEGFYTIGSSGHEGNAAVAAALAPTDPALLHYRSAAFYCTRSGKVADAARDVLRGVVARRSPPTCRGPSGWPSRWPGPGRRAAGRRRRSRSPRSATRRPTTPARPRRSTRPAGSTTPTCGYRCCWSARTTGSG
jgi:hypothetical protein